MEFYKLYYIVHQRTDWIHLYRWQRSVMWRFCMSFRELCGLPATVDFNMPIRTEYVIHPRVRDEGTPPAQFGMKLAAKKRRRFNEKF